MSVSLVQTLETLEATMAVHKRKRSFNYHDCLDFLAYSKLRRRSDTATAKALQKPIKSAISM